MHVLLAVVESAVLLWKPSWCLLLVSLPLSLLLVGMTSSRLLPLLLSHVCFSVFSPSLLSVFACAVTAVPVITDIRDGLLDSDVSAQTFSFTMHANWDVLTFGVPIYRLDAYIGLVSSTGAVTPIPRRDSTVLWTTSITSNASFAFANLTLSDGQTYSMCIR